jgi:hypothetical protein
MAAEGTTHTLDSIAIMRRAAFFPAGFVCARKRADQAGGVNGLPPGDASGPVTIRPAGKMPSGPDQKAMAAVPHGHPMLTESCEIGGDAQLLCASM